MFINIRVLKLCSTDWKSCLIDYIYRIRAIQCTNAFYYYMYMYYYHYYLAKEDQIVGTVNYLA